MSTPKVQDSITSTDLDVDSSSSSTTRVCWHPDCKKPLVRRKDERKNSFERRRHCDYSCAQSNPLRRKKQAEEYARTRDEEKKNCGFCSSSFTRRRGEARADFLHRLTCSRKCADDKRKAERREQIAKEKKICKVCKGEFTRDVDRKHIESPASFKQRETCGPSCRTSKKKEEHPWEKKGSGGGKPSLPPVSECPTPIPEAPKPKMVEVWRPASWGGPFKRKVS